MSRPHLLSSATPCSTSERLQRSLIYTANVAISYVKAFTLLMLSSLLMCYSDRFALMLVAMTCVPAVAVDLDKSLTECLSQLQRLSHRCSPGVRIFRTSLRHHHR